jgi:hypothetical protein
MPAARAIEHENYVRSLFASRVPSLARAAESYVGSIVALVFPSNVKPSGAVARSCAAGVTPIVSRSARPSISPGRAVIPIATSRCDTRPEAQTSSTRRVRVPAPCLVPPHQAGRACALSRLVWIESVACQAFPCKLDFRACRQTTVSVRHPVRGICGVTWSERDTSLYIIKAAAPHIIEALASSAKYPQLPACLSYMDTRGNFLLPAPEGAQVWRRNNYRFGDAVPALLTLPNCAVTSRLDRVQRELLVRCLQS